jgi:transcriptional regulator
MYQPRHHREERREVLYQLIAEHPLATLITHSAGGLIANLVPFTRDGDVLQAHVARGNDQIASLTAAADTMVVFQGPQAYISPAWYASKREHGKVVPTWNYVTVQVRGTPRVIEDTDWLLKQITALTRAQEQHRPAPWSVNDAPADYIAAQLKGIIGVEIAIACIEGKWKVSQNRSLADREGVINGLRNETGNTAMAELVQATCSTSAP